MEKIFKAVKYHVEDTVLAKFHLQTDLVLICSDRTCFFNQNSPKLHLKFKELAEQNQEELLYISYEVEALLSSTSLISVLCEKSSALRLLSQQRIWEVQMLRIPCGEFLYFGFMDVGGSVYRHFFCPASNNCTLPSVATSPELWSNNQLPKAWDRRKGKTKTVKAAFI